MYRLLPTILQRSYIEHSLMNDYCCYEDYIHIYIYIYKYINVERDGMGIPLVKTNYFSQLVLAVLKGYVEFVIYKCWRIFDVISRLTSVILDHVQIRKIMEVNRESAWNGFNLGLGSDQTTLKSQLSLSRNFLAVLVFF